MIKKIVVNIDIETGDESVYQSFVALLWSYLPAYLKQMKTQSEELKYVSDISWLPEMTDKEKSDKTFGLIKHHFESYVTTMAQMWHIKQAYKFLDDVVEDLWVKKL